MRATDATVAGEDDKRTIIKREQRTSPDSRAAIGQLSYAPTTQTTVVTTTTTTTTSFPPFIIKPPCRLSERDPKQYPLASSPTPQSLKRFSFDYMGKPVCFEEGDDAEQILQEVSSVRPGTRRFHSVPTLSQSSY